MPKRTIGNPSRNPTNRAIGIAGRMVTPHSRRPRQASVLETIRLLKEGLSTEEVAKLRRRTERTVVLNLRDDIARSLDEAYSGSSMWSIRSFATGPSRGRVTTGADWREGQNRSWADCPIAGCTNRINRRTRPLVCRAHWDTLPASLKAGLRDHKLDRKEAAARIVRYLNIRTSFRQKAGLAS